MAQQLNIHSVVRDTLRKNAFSNAGTLPPTRLDTLAMQIGHFLTADQANGANPLGRTLFSQGVGLSSITAVLIAVQHSYLQHNDHESVLEAARRAAVRKVVVATSGGPLYGESRSRQLPAKESHAQVARSPHGVAARAVLDYLRLYRQLHDLEYTALALANVYGPRQRPGPAGAGGAERR